MSPSTEPCSPLPPEGAPPARVEGAPPAASIALCLGWLLLLLWLSIGLARAPEGAVDPETAAALDRTVEWVAAAPRPTGSAAVRVVQDELTRELEAAGFDVELQEGDVLVERWGRLLGGHVRNIVACRPGTLREQSLLLVAHTDSVPNAAGAGDDAAGLAAVMAAARAIGAGPPTRNDVVVLLSDGEEAGLLGATFFAREHPRWSYTGAILNFEGRGNSGPSIMFHTGPGSGALVRALADTPYPVAGSLGPTVFSLLPNDTDLSALPGKPGLDFAFVGGLRFYHSSDDRPEWLSRQTLQHHAATAVALSARLADTDLSRPPEGDEEPDPVYFNLPFGLLVLPPRSMPALAVAAAALWLFSLFRLRPGVGPTLLGALFASLSALGSAGLVLGTGALLGLLSPVETAHQGFDSPLSSVLQPLFTLVGLLPALGLAAVTRRWDRGGGPALGGSLVWIGLALWLGATMPGAAYPLVLPAFGFGLCLTLRAFGGARPGRLGALLVGLPIVLLLLVPLALLLGATLPLFGWGFGLAPLSMALGPLWGLLDIPALQPGRKSLGMGLLVALLGLAGVVSYTQEPGRWPQPYHLVHLTDEAGPRWISGEEAREGWLQELLPASSPLSDAAPDVMLFGGKAVEAGGPDLGTLPPEISVEAEHGDATTLRLRSRRGARALVFRAPPGTPFLSVDGGSGPIQIQGRGRAEWLYWQDPPEAGLLVQLSLQEGGEYVLVDETDGLPVEVPEGWWSRPFPWSAVTLGRTSFIR